MQSSTKGKTVFIAIGSNTGDSKAHIKTAIERLSNLGSDIQISNLYRSKPEGFLDQPDFLNCAVSIFTSLSPEELLKKLQAIESEMGRIRTFKNAPRNIDLDIIYFQDEVRNTPALTIPHPAADQREFVLKPLNDIAHTFTPPNSISSVSALLSTLMASKKTPTCERIDW